MRPVAVGLKLITIAPILSSEDGSTGYDADGFANQAQQDLLAENAGAFKFSRPEDVSHQSNRWY